MHELAAKLGTSKSSIERDLATLEEHFMIVARQVTKQKRMYRLERGTTRSSIRLAPEEMHLLEAALAAFPETDPTSVMVLLAKLQGLVAGGCR